jgi:hypothetical protein
MEAKERLLLPYPMEAKELCTDLLDIHLAPPALFCFLEEKIRTLTVFVIVDL